MKSGRGSLRCRPWFAFGLVLMVCGPLQAAVYDLATDWSDTANPNGVWALWKSPGKLFTIRQTDYFADGSNQVAWADDQIGPPEPDGRYHVPAWMKATGTWSLVTPGTIVMHGVDPNVTPGLSYSSVTWTSPSDGTISIEGGVWHGGLNRPQIWSIRKNGTTLSSGEFNYTDPYTQANPFDFASGSGGAGALNQFVSTGDVIELVIGPKSGTVGTFVGLTFAIELVPEPASLCLLSLGGLFLLRRRRS